MNEPSEVEAFKIHHIVHTLGSGGAEHVAFELAREQATQGHKVTIWTLGSLAPMSRASLIADQRRMELTRVGCHIQHLPFGARSVLRNGLVMRKKLNSMGMHSSARVILHAHSAVGAAICVVAGQFARFFSIHSSHFNFPRAFLRLLVPFQSALIAGSHTVARELSVALGVEVSSVPYGVVKPSPNRLCSAEIKDAGEIHLLFVGRLVPQKNPLALLEALNILKTRYNVSRAVSLTVIGDGELRTDMESMMRDFSLDEQVEFLGIRDDWTEWLREADYLVLPSVFEGFPIVALEAVAHGTPVILGPFSGAQEFITTYSCGIALAESSGAALAEALEGLLTRPHAREQTLREMSLTAGQFFENHGTRTMANNYGRLYRSVVMRD